MISFWFFLNVQITYEETKDQRSNSFFSPRAHTSKSHEMGFNIRTNSKLSTNSLFSIYYVSGTALSTFLSNLNLTTLWRKYYFCPSFTDV